MHAIDFSFIKAGQPILFHNLSYGQTVNLPVSLPVGGLEMKAIYFACISWPIIYILPATIDQWPTGRLTGHFQTKFDFKGPKDIRYKIAQY